MSGLSAPVVLREGAGHFLPVERPVELAGAVRRLAALADGEPPPVEPAGPPG